MKIFALLLGLVLLSACADSGDEESSTEPKKATPVDAAREARDRAEGVERRLKELWIYQDVTTEGGVQKSATIFSRTVEVGEGELQPEPDAQLVLRDHPSWGRSAYLLLAQARFKCGKPCAMMIAFDTGDPQRFTGLQADSGKGPALFINNETAFIAALKQARLVHIALPKDSGLVSSLSFEVGGYDLSRYH